MKNNRIQEILNILKTGGLIEINLDRVEAGEKEHPKLYDHTGSRREISQKEFNLLLTGGFIEPQKSNGGVLVYRVAGFLA